MKQNKMMSKWNEIVNNEIIKWMSKINLKWARIEGKGFLAKWIMNVKICQKQMKWNVNVQIKVIEMNENLNNEMWK